jgi:hypothetical protein
MLSFHYCHCINVVLAHKTGENVGDHFVIFEVCFGNNIKWKINNQLSEENVINHAVRRGYTLSPKLFNVSAMTLNRNQIYTEGIFLSTIAKSNTLRFADDQVIMVDSEDSLQGWVFYTAKHSKVWNANITRKTWDFGIFRTKPCKM